MKMTIECNSFNTVNGKYYCNSMNSNYVDKTGKQVSIP